MKNLSTINRENSWQLYYNSADAWRAMYDACSNAKYEIKMEQYIFENDECGKIFLELFIKKASEGVKIFILCDIFGSKAIYASTLVMKLKQNGGEIYFYNAFIWKKIIIPWHFFPRTHIKTLLVDSDIAFTGGVCLAKRMQNWRDTHISVKGPVTEQIAQSFRDIENQVKFKKRITSPVNTTSYEKEYGCIYLVHNPSLFGNAIYKAFKCAIINAKYEIYISTSFFIPNKKFIRLLIKASKRGVKVHLLVPEYSDVRLADWIFLSYAETLLKSGIRIYCYNKSVLHCKTMVIDGSWSTVGSTNLDILSFFYNREANLICTNPKMAEQLKQQFHNDLAYSKILTLENLKDRPFLKKIIGYCGRALKLFLLRRIHAKRSDNAI